MADRLRQQAEHISGVLADPENQNFIEDTQQADELELLLLMAIHFERELALRVAMIQLKEEFQEMSHANSGILH